MGVDHFISHHKTGEGKEKIKKRKENAETETRSTTKKKYVQV